MNISITYEGESMSGILMPDGTALVSDGLWAGERLESGTFMYKQIIPMVYTPTPSVTYVKAGGNRERISRIAAARKRADDRYFT